VKPYLVLGTYKPSKWRASTVGRELTDLTCELGLLPHYDPVHGPLELTGRNWVSKVLHAEVRRRTFKTNQAESFHYDGDLQEGSKPDCAIVLWASNHPTEIKWTNQHGVAAFRKHEDEIYQPRPYEIVIFHNLHCLHRRPAGVPRIRWVYRQRVSIPSRDVLELP
jgi:hypothetical protein